MLLHRKKGNYSGLLTACGSSQEVFVLRAVPPAAAQPAAQKDASRQRRRGIRYLSSYKEREKYGGDHREI